MRRITRFPLALGISTFLHLLILFSLLALNILPAQKALNQIKVNYVKLAPRAASFGPSSLDTAAKRAIKELTQKELDKIGLGQRLILSDKNAIAEKGFSAQRISAQKPTLTTTEFVKPQTIKLSPVEIESLNKMAENPAYLTYSNYLRENIRRSLNNKLADVHEKGLVCLKFSLNTDGSLKEYHLVEAQTNASDKLKRTSIDGLLEAAPFPSLPKELNSPDDTFSVIIHFIKGEN